MAFIKGEHTETELIQLVASGSEEAFACLFDSYKNDLYYLALSITRSAAVAEDIIQEVFLKIWLKRVELSAVENFRGYLVVVTRRVILNELRKQMRLKSRENNFMQEAPAITQDNIENSLQEKQYDGLVQDVLKQLPERQAAVFTMIKLQGYSREEVAVKLGLSPETVKKHLERASKTVRAFLLVQLADYKGATLLLALFLIS